MHNSAQRYVFTSESVSEGHPDKICDQISDRILDLYLAKDPHARVAVETLATVNQVVLAGEIASAAVIHEQEIDRAIRDVVREIGYVQEHMFHWEDIKILNLLHAQSPDIAQGVAQEETIGAGDQGIMFGYACRETPTLMPAPIYYAHKILAALSKERHLGQLKRLGPDAKTQLSVVYEDGVPTHLHSLVLSTQHDDTLSVAMVKDKVMPIVKKALPKGWLRPQTEIYINPTGRFVIGGPYGDAGLTGRKIIVDTYGGAAPHGGGAFSGKDPTKVDRSATYMARYLAKNVVVAGLAEKCLIQICYAIGMAHPLAVYVNTFGTSKVSEERLSQVLQEVVDLTPKGIIDHLKLRQPFYLQTASYGHFGRDYDAVTGCFSWERVDLVSALKQAFHLH